VLINTLNRNSAIVYPILIHMHNLKSSVKLWVSATSQLFKTTSTVSDFQSCRQRGREG